MRPWMETLILCYKILQNRLKGVTLKYSIFAQKYVWSTYLDILSQMGLNTGMWKTAFVLSTYIPRNYMKVVLKIKRGLGVPR